MGVFRDSEQLMGDFQWSPTTWADNTTFNSSATMTVYPAAVAIPNPEPQPVDRGPIGWLRDQVTEVCELARAA